MYSEERRLEMMKEYKKLYKGVFDEIYPAEDLREKLNCKSFKHKKLKISWVAIIMMFVIVGTATGIEAAMNHFSFLNVFTKKNESAYQIEIDANRIKIEDLNGQITEVKEIVKKQINEHKSYMNDDPSQYTKYFNSIDKCMQYIGFDEKYYVIDESSSAILNVKCNEEGDILSIRIETDYVMEGKNVQVWYYIFTEKEDDDSIFESIITDKIDYKIQDKTLDDGTVVPVIISESNIETYFTKGHLTYAINVANDSKNIEGATEIVNKVLDSFE